MDEKEVVEITPAEQVEIIPPESQKSVNQLLDETYGTKQQFPMVVPKFEKCRKSKIEIAGDHVVQHLVQLVTTTDLSYQQMAKKLNDTYSLDLTKQNIVHFFRSQKEIIDELVVEQKSLAKVRCDMYLEYNTVLVGDIKLLDDQIQKIKEDELISSENKAKVIGDLLDKKGKLLIRHARLAGNIIEDSGGMTANNMQINIYGADDKSDIINRMKKANFNLPKPPVK